MIPLIILNLSGSEIRDVPSGRRLTTNNQVVTGDPETEPAGVVSGTQAEENAIAGVGIVRFDPGRDREIIGEAQGGVLQIDVVTKAVERQGTSNFTGGPTRRPGGDLGTGSVFQESAGV